jgi:hypothetical protein
MRFTPSRLVMVTFTAALALILAASFTPTFAASETLVLNEIDYDQPGTDNAEFIEIKNASAEAVELAGFSVILINGAGTNPVYRTIPLEGSLAGGDYLVICGGGGSVPNCDLALPINLNVIQNGERDGVALLLEGAVFDIVAYEGDLPEPYNVTGRTLLDQGSGGLSRCPDGVDTDAETDFVYAPITPGEANRCPSRVVVTTPETPAPTEVAQGPTATAAPSVPAECGAEATLIHAVQGDDAASPIAGQLVAIEGVVVGDYQQQGSFGGFYVQEEDTDADDNPATSEGIFVFERSTAVNVGDQVRVIGTVTEFASGGQTMTQIAQVQSVTVCDGADATASAVPLPLPLPDGVSLEQYEGMLVIIDDELTVTDTYNLGRFGEVGLAVGGRLYQPTNLVAPGPDAIALAADNAARFILLDDAGTQQNRDPIAYPQGGLSATNTLRLGDTLPELTGILDQRFGTYRIQPVGAIEFEATNPRQDAPPSPVGNVRVASANVLNYFNGNGLGGGFPTERGADTLVEFERQRLKTLTSLLAMDADVIGLMEIENDGYGPDSALQDLVNGLNDETAPGTYAFIEPDESLGTDAIRVALIYRPGNVSPMGAAAVLSEGPFGQYRPALAQTFQHSESGEVFTVAVNHFKSKSCSGAGGENADQGDGQGCFNASRVEAAEVLTEWLADDPTGSGDPDVLIIGDLNAYAMEDPITTLIDAGYVNLIMQFAGDEAYSYVFSGQSGYLDHALATESLAAQTVNVLEWHINSDEPRTLDYNTEFKSPAQVQSLFAPDPFRASDHDPVIIDLQLGAGDRVGTQEPEVTPEETAIAVEETPAVEVTETVAVEPTDTVDLTPMVEPVVEDATEQPESTAALIDESEEETPVEVAQVNTPTAAVEVTDAVEDEESTETPEAEETETAEPTEDAAEPTEDAEATATEEADDATPEATPVVEDGEAGDDAADDGDTDNTGLIALIVAVIAVIVGAVGFFLNQGRRDGTTPPANGR